MNFAIVDSLARCIAARFSRRNGLGLLAGVVLLRIGRVDPGLAKKKKAKKVTLCLNRATVRTAKKRAKKLLKQGALRGECLCGTGGPCTVFATSSAFTGALGGLSGADAKCTQLANAAGLGGTYVAWLSAGASTPAIRFDTINAGPWLLPRNATDGASPPTVASDFADLITCGVTCLQHEIDRNQNGTVIADDLAVWTGTGKDGVAQPETCQGWTSGVIADFGLLGDGGKVDALWTDAGTLASCNTERLLYCFQQSA